MRRVCRLAGVAAVSMAAWAGTALAQPTHVIRPAEDLGFLTSFNYHLSLEYIEEADPQFDWVGHFGGDFDFVGGPRGRANAAFDYEAVLGDELQPFDPNQGNYRIELLGAGRVGRLEIGMLFHHTSRHLGDRAKDFGIAWNFLGPQVAWTRERPGEVLQVRGRALGAVMTDYVDYSGEFSADVLYRHRLRSMTSLVVRAEALARTINGRHSGRGAQTGGRIEAAYRIAGRGPGLELFAGVERRLDASAFVAQPMTWALVGMRIMSPD